MIERIAYLQGTNSVHEDWKHVDKKVIHSDQDQVIFHLIDVSKFLYSRIVIEKVGVSVGFGTEKKEEVVMSEYKTLSEWFGHSKRGDGRKFTLATAETGWFFEPIYRTDSGYWHGLEVDGLSYKQHEDAAVYRLWTEPKKTKKVKMYCPVYKEQENGLFSGTYYRNSKESFCYVKNICGWLEQEVEVTE